MNYLQNRITNPSYDIINQEVGAHPIFSSEDLKKFSLPFFDITVSAGFASIAEDEKHSRVDLNELLIKRPSATFLLRVNGHSMINAGIHHNDLLVVDRSISPTTGKIVIAAIDGELTVKRLKVEKNKVTLLAENKDYPSLEILDPTQLKIFGVVTYVIHNCLTN